jgi:hypothetical protein
MITAAMARARAISMDWLGAHRRTVGVSALVAAVAGFVTYLVVAVPVASAPLQNGHQLFFCPLWAPPVPRSQATLHWRGALLAAIFVVLVDSFVLLAYWRGRRGRRREQVTRGQWTPAPTLRLQRVPVHIAGINAAASALLVFAAAMQGYALWVIALFGLAPWLPLVVSELGWKYERYGAWALFGVIVMLQLGHMGEHSVQVLQLLLSGGQLAQSHGVFGQLDFETVHFIWDSAIWLSLCLLLRPFASGNRWLWVAFAAASFHEVEHVYLFWIYHAHPTFYAAGGFERVTARPALPALRLQLPRHLADGVGFLGRDQARATHMAGARVASADDRRPHPDIAPRLLLSAERSHERVCEDVVAPWCAAATSSLISRRPEPFVAGSNQLRQRRPFGGVGASGGEQERLMPAPPLRLVVVRCAGAHPKDVPDEWS